eukprot:SAG11_NODE_2047_length_3884_cov_1.573844_6_plen_198_part_00
MIFCWQVNPADYLLDIIGGEAHCDSDPSLSHEELPRKWMEDTRFNTHRATAGGTALLSPPELASQGGLSDPKLSDPKQRQGAKFSTQLMLFTIRGVQQQFRPFRTIIVDYALIFLAGALLGMLSPNITWAVTRVICLCASIYRPHTKAEAHAGCLHTDTLRHHPSPFTRGVLMWQMRCDCLRLPACCTRHGEQEHGA